MIRSPTLDWSCASWNDDLALQCCSYIDSAVPLVDVVSVDSRRLEVNWILHWGPWILSRKRSYLYTFWYIRTDDSRVSKLVGWYRDAHVDKDTLFWERCLGEKYDDRTLKTPVCEPWKGVTNAHHPDIWFWSQLETTTNTTIGHIFTYYGLKSVQFCGSTTVVLSIVAHRAICVDLGRWRCLPK
jgi:hypothetical protein